MRTPLFSSLSFLAMFTTLFSALAAENNPDEFLNLQNVARAQVGVPPLVWNGTLAVFASKYEPTCNNSRIGPYGENIAGGYEAATIYQAVSGWVAQRSSYNYRDNSCSLGEGKCKEYTQVVWRNSARVGCANLICGAGWPVVVCEYDPPGNLPGQKPY